jgi:glc operon protein GlcG
MRRFVIPAMIGAALFARSAPQAQQSVAPAAPSLDTIPEKVPFSESYGTPISAQRAMSLVQAGVAEATKKGWAMNIAVVDSGANLVTFLRMDGAQLASISIAEHKARASAKYRRPTKAFEDAIQKNDNKYVMKLDDIVTSRGGGTAGQESVTGLFC